MSNNLQQLFVSPQQCSIRSPPFTHTPSTLGPVQPVIPSFLLTKLTKELRLKIFNYVAAQPRIHVAQINESNSYSYSECLEDLDLEESDPRYEPMIATRKLRLNDPNDSIDPTFCNNHCTCQLTVNPDTIGLIRHDHQY
ncbi:hypothetical protein MRB53_041152 [Persea americana]|nr:hypothetical protein MRB53_041152 [Persea americana]